MPGPRGKNGFPALDLEFKAGEEDVLSGALFAAGTTGIEERGEGRLRAFFPVVPSASAIRVLSRLGARVSRLWVPDEDWVRRSRARARPVRVGPLLVRAPWSRARPARDGHGIVIDPARAFGTGSHESTRLVLAALVSRPPRGEVVIDVGTGSGILALAALRLGARRTLALDVDPEAVAAARSNARRNGLADRLELVQGGPASLRFSAPRVLANLTATLLERLASDIARRVAPGGELLASGFLERDVGDLSRRYAAEGLAASATSAEAGWSLLRFVRRRGSRS